MEMVIDREIPRDTMSWLMLVKKEALGMEEQPRKRYLWKALDRQVLAVLRVWPEAADVKVYIGAVPGRDHDDEWQEVARHGSKVSEKLARAIFYQLETYDFTYSMF